MTLSFHMVAERGNFLALDLGGTNFRVLLIRLEGGKAKITSKIYSVSEDLMTGLGSEARYSRHYSLKTVYMYYLSRLA
jgi:hexokinase